MKLSGLEIEGLPPSPPLHHRSVSLEETYGSPDWRERVASAVTLSSHSDGSAGLPAHDRLPRRSWKYPSLAGANMF